MQTTRLCTCGRILDHHHVLALLAAETEFRDRLVGVRQQALLVGGINPGPRHHLRAVARANLVLVGVDQRVERGPIDQSLFDEQRFQRLHSQGHVRRNCLVSMARGCVRDLARARQDRLPPLLRPQWLLSPKNHAWSISWDAPFPQEFLSRILTPNSLQSKCRPKVAQASACGFKSRTRNVKPTG